MPINYASDMAYMPGIALHTPVIHTFDAIGPGRQLPVAYFGRIQRLQGYLQGDMYNLVFDALPDSYPGMPPRPAQTEADMQALALEHLRQVPALESADLVIAPWPEQIAEYYRNALLGQKPVIKGNDAFDEAFKPYAYRFWQTLYELLGDWAATDRMIVGVRQSDLTGGYEPIRIDPANYLPVVDRFDAHNITGHILLFTWREWQDGDAIDATLTDNRIRIIKILADGSVESDEVYAFDTGNIVGEAIASSDDPVADMQIWYIRTGNNLLPRCETTIREIIIRQSLWSKYLNQTARPLVNRELAGAAVAAYGDNGAAEWAQPPSEIAESSKVELDWLVQQLHYHSGISASTIGEGLGKGESGVARAEARFTSAQIIATLRHELENLLPQLFEAMQLPAEGVEVTWLTEPASTMAEQRDQTVQLLQAGIIDIAEARQAIGLEPNDELESADSAMREAAVDTAQNGAITQNEE